MKTGTTKTLRVGISYETKNNRGPGGGGFIPMFFSDLSANDDQVKAEFLLKYPLNEELEEQLTSFTISDKAVVERLKYQQDLPITCPRRDEGFGHGETLQDMVRDNGTCSFCGSLVPEAFWDLVEAGAELGPTDKNYKVYVNPPPHLKYSVMETGMAKLYFQHFRTEDIDRFIRMYNEKKMKIEYPGHFYRLPFFCKMSDEEKG